MTGPNSGRTGPSGAGAAMATGTASGTWTGRPEAYEPSMRPPDRAIAVLT